MKVRKCVPLPGRKFVDVDYRCDECGAEVLRAVPSGRQARRHRRLIERLLGGRGQYRP
jgi:hypothetical protein